jgi:hypothetical protein
MAGLAAVLIALSACTGPAATPTPAAATSTSAAAMDTPTATEAATEPPGSSAPPAEAPVAGDIPDDQVFVPYSPPDRRYSLSVPEGWSRSEVGGAVVFTDKFNSIRVETVPRPAGAPDVGSARAEELPVIAATTPGFRAGDVVAVTRKGGPAVLITYSATSPVDPVTGKTVVTSVERYEFWNGGQEGIVTLSGAEGADNVDPWRMVSDSFRWP